MNLLYLFFIFLYSFSSYFKPLDLKKIFKFSSYSFKFFGANENFMETYFLQSHKNRTSLIPKVLTLENLNQKNSSLFKNLKSDQNSKKYFEDLFKKLLNKNKEEIDSTCQNHSVNIKRKKTVSFAAKLESFLYYKTDKTNLKEMMKNFEKNKTPILKDFENNLKLDTNQKKLFYLTEEDFKKEKENFLCTRSIGWNIEEDNKLESDIEKIDSIKNYIFISRSAFAIPLSLKEFSNFQIKKI